MSRRIEYKKGELVGECLFHYDVESTTAIRRAAFTCQKCANKAVFEADVADVKRGKTRSCGCLYVFPKKHGLTNNRHYIIWVGIRNRCYNPNSYGYKWYGRRGIKMFYKWKDDPVAFVKYLSSLHGGDDASLTLDRIDNNGNYEPGNLRWTTNHVQVCNRNIMSSNTSGFTGIVWDNLNAKWMARICVNYKKIGLGRFNRKQDAVAARNEYIIKMGLSAEYSIQ